MIFLNLFILLGLRCTSVFSRLAVLHAQAQSNEKKFCVETNTAVGITPGNSSTQFFPLRNLLPWDACEPPSEEIENMTGTYALVERYPCTFAKKALIVQAEGARGVIIDMSSKEPTTTAKPLVNATTISSLNTTNETIIEGLVTIPVLLLKSEIIKELLALGNDIRIKVFIDSKNRLEYSHVIVWLWAVGTLFAGSFWRGFTHSKYIRKVRRRRVRISGSSIPTPTNLKMSTETITTIILVVVGVVLMSSLLLLLYFYYSYLVYFIIFIFSIACVTSTFQIFDSFFKHIKFSIYKFPSAKICGIKCSFNLVQIFLLIIALAVVIYWIIIRNDRYSWILQDLLGTIFIVNLLRNFRLPNAMIPTVAGLILILYDVFFVFITPYLTPKKESVMVKVATSGGEVGEKLPMIFVVPHIKLSDLESVCDMAPVSLLGYGDVIIPGILTAYLHTYDVEIGGKRVYFITTVIGYALGLLATFVSMLFMNSPQPALLYLVPFTLIPMYVLALIRKEVKAIWLGKPVLSPHYVRMSVTDTGAGTETTAVSAEAGQLLTSAEGTNS